MGHDLPAGARDRPAWGALAVYALLGAILVATEIVHHVLEASGTLSALFFLLGLVPVAYLALSRGLRTGLAATLVLALYALHYVGPHEVLVEPTWEALRAALVVLVLGVGMSVPMSRVKAREDRLRAALERRAREAEERNRDLTQANEALEAFGYMVSHDLKEPVRALENYLDAALEEWPRDEARSLLAEAYDANARLTRMLNGLLAYSRASSHTLTPRPVHLPEVIRGDVCRSHYADLLRERRVLLSVDETIPPVLGDEVVLCQVFGNLILNAIRHNAREDPVVRVRAAAATATHLDVVVEDNGPGFPPEVLAQLGPTRPPGLPSIRSGFGLLIANRAAQRLRGRLWLENAPGGKGGRAHVEIPRVPADAPDPPSPSFQDVEGPRRRSGASRTTFP